MISKKIALPVFLTVEAVLYVLILTAGGALARWSSFLSIVLCFAFALTAGKNPWIRAGLACTVAADFFLVLLEQKLPGMVCFLAAQSLYAGMLYKQDGKKMFLWIRLAAVAVIELIAVLVLRGKTDALVLISVAYYAMLIINLLQSYHAYKLLSLAFFLFLLCDTVIGLQVAATGYLSVSPDSALYRFLFMPFNLAWFFYLPSQVLIAIFGESALKPKAGCNSGILSGQ